MEPGRSGQPEHGPRADYAVGEKEPAMPIPRPVVPSVTPTRSGGGSLIEPGSETPDQRSPTLSQRIRALQPPDVARQALSELGVLAHELSNLSELLEAAGLARTHQNAYFEAANSYLGLAQKAWEAVAEERLEQTGAEPEYRQRAISVARRITHLQQEARAASANSSFTLSRRTPFYWRRRTRLIRDGLRVWQDGLSSPPNSTDLGHGLFLLRGFLGLAAAGSFCLGFLDFLVGATLTMLSLFGVGLVALLAAAVISGSILDLTRFSVAVLATVLVWVFVLLMAVNGPLKLGLLLGASVFSPTRTTRNSGTGSRVIAIALHVWWVAVGVVAAPALLGALVLGVLAVRGSVVVSSLGSVHHVLVLAGTALALGTASLVVVCVALLLLLAIPALVLTSLRAAADLAGSPGVVPVARYYAVQPALVVDAILTGALVIAVWVTTTILGLRNFVLFTIALPFGGPHSDTLSISLRSIALFIALVLPYLVLLDLPYRIGLRNWQRAWLADLTSRRADIESHIRRLSITDPRTGMQDTSEDNLRSMQYDLVLLQFYQGKIEEAQKVSSSPAPRQSRFLALVIVVIAALILDSGATWLVHLLPLMGG
ncbi:MAG: hypothetical protein ACLQUY_00830 [Ktedonobacterales bacterium]